METTLRWQISKTIHFIFNCFWCVPDFEYSDKEIMEKLLFCSLSYTSNTPNFYSSVLTPWPFWTNLKNPTLLFLPGHSFRRSQTTDVLFGGVLSGITDIISLEESWGFLLGTLLPSGKCLTCDIFPSLQTSQIFEEWGYRTAKEQRFNTVL